MCRKYFYNDKGYMSVDDPARATWVCVNAPDADDVRFLIEDEKYPSEKGRLCQSFFTGELCGKNAMFNLNENNRIVMAQYPTDMRMGVNCLSGQVRMVGLDPSNGDVYIFVGKSRQVMKILHWEHGGYVVYYKRLEEGRFHPRIFLRQGVGFRSMKWSELVLLMEGISPKVARRHRYEKS